MNILDRTLQLFTKMRGSVIEAAGALWEVQKKEAWKGQYASWGDFVDECGISQGFASKLLQVHQFYVIDAKVSQRKLAEVDSERLYLALKLPQGTADERLLKASLLSRQELREQTVLEETGSECMHTVHICARCKKRV